jgi:hypothetical protein
MIDGYSRYMSARTCTTESAALAVELMTEIFGVRGVAIGARRPGHLDE